jgi:hypothetical protein
MKITLLASELHDTEALEGFLVGLADKYPHATIVLAKVTAAESQVIARAPQLGLIVTTTPLDLANDVNTISTLLSIESDVLVLVGGGRRMKKIDQALKVRSLPKFKPVHVVAVLPKLGSVTNDQLALSA